MAKLTVSIAGVQSMRTKVDPVVFIRWCREQGNGWEKIAAAGALINGETGDRAIIESDTIFIGDKRLTLRCEASRSLALLLQSCGLSGVAAAKRVLGEAIFAVLSADRHHNVRTISFFAL